MPLVDGQLAIAAAGTAQQITADETAITFLALIANDDNTGVIVVGASTVVAEVDETIRGVTVPQSAINMGAGPLIFQNMDGSHFDLSDFYFDSNVSADGFGFLYRTV